MSIFDDIREYIDLRLDKLRNETFRVIADIAGSLVTIIVLLIILSIVLSALVFGGILVLGEVLDSYALGAFIAAGALLVVLTVLWLCRKKLFRSTFAKMLSGHSYSELGENIDEVDSKIAASGSNVISNALSTVIISLFSKKQ